MYVMYFELYYKVRPFEFHAACDCIVLGRVERNQWHMAWTNLQLPIRQWGAGNVYLLVLSSWKVNIPENPIAVMIQACRPLVCRVCHGTPKFWQIS